MSDKGKLSIGYVAKSKDDNGRGWVSQNFDVVVRRSGYVVATIGHIWSDKVPKKKRIWIAYSDAHLGRHATRAEAIEAVKAYARLTLSRAIQEGVL